MMIVIMIMIKVMVIMIVIINDNDDDGDGDDDDGDVITIIKIISVCNLRSLSKIRTRYSSNCSGDLTLCVDSMYVSHTCKAVNSD